MLNIFHKSKSVHYTFFNSVRLSVCRAVRTLLIVIHFWMHLNIFFNLQRDYSSIFSKIIYHCKKYLSPCDCTCLDNIQHVSQNRNYGSSDIFYLLHFIFSTYFSCLSIIKMGLWTFHICLTFDLVFFLEQLTKQI